MFVSGAMVRFDAPFPNVRQRSPVAMKPALSLLGLTFVLLLAYITPVVQDLIFEKTSERLNRQFIAKLDRAKLPGKSYADLVAAVGKPTVVDRHAPMITDRSGQVVTVFESYTVAIYRFMPYYWYQNGVAVRMNSKDEIVEYHVEY